MSSEILEQKAKNLWFRKVAGLATFISMMFAMPVTIATNPEKLYLIPVWIVGLIAAGVLTNRDQ